MSQITSQSVRRTHNNARLPFEGASIHDSRPTGSPGNARRPVAYRHGAGHRALHHHLRAAAGNQNRQLHACEQRCMRSAIYQHPEQPMSMGGDRRVGRPAVGRQHLRQCKRPSRPIHQARWRSAQPMSRNRDTCRFGSHMQLSKRVLHGEAAYRRQNCCRPALGSAGTGDAAEMHAPGRFQPAERMPHTNPELPAGAASGMCRRRIATQLSLLFCRLPPTNQR